MSKNCIYRFEGKEYTLEEFEEVIRNLFFGKQSSVKPGVTELFESNPELANSIYEALGYSEKTDYRKEEQFNYNNVKSKYNFESVNSLLNSIYNNTKNPNFKRLSSTFSKIKNLEDINLIENNSLSINGNYSLNTNTISINVDRIIKRSNTKGYDAEFMLEQTILHEIVHALTKKATSTSEKNEFIRNIENLAYKLYSKELNDSKSDFNKYLQIQNEIKYNRENVSKDDYEFVADRQFKFYGLTNLDEFLTMSMTNPDFRFTLKQTNLWEQLMYAISKFLGIVKTDLDFLENNFDKFLKSTYGVNLESQVTPQQKQQALEVYSSYLSTIFPESKVQDIVYHGITTNLNERFDKFSKKFFNSGKGRYGENGFFFSENKEEVNKNYNSSGLITAILNLKNTSSDIYKNTWKETIDYLTEPLEIYGGKTDLDYLSEGYRAAAWYKEGNWKRQVEALKEDGWKIEETATSYIKLGKISAQEKQYYYHLKKNLEKGTLPFNVNNSIEAIRKAKEQELDGLIYENILEESSIDKHNQYIVFEPEQIHILGTEQDLQSFEKFVNDSKKTPVTAQQEQLATQFSKAISTIAANQVSFPISTAPLEAEMEQDLIEAQGDLNISEGVKGESAMAEENSDIEKVDFVESYLQKDSAVNPVDKISRSVKIWLNRLTYYGANGKFNTVSEAFGVYKMYFDLNAMNLETFESFSESLRERFGNEVLEITNIRDYQTIREDAQKASDFMVRYKSFLNKAGKTSVLMYSGSDPKKSRESREEFTRIVKENQEEFNALEQELLTIIALPSNATDALKTAYENILSKFRTTGFYKNSNATKQILRDYFTKRNYTEVSQVSAAKSLYKALIMLGQEYYAKTYTFEKREFLKNDKGEFLLDDNGNILTSEPVKEIAEYTDDTRFLDDKTFLYKGIEVKLPFKVSNRKQIIKHLEETMAKVGHEWGVHFFDNQLMQLWINYQNKKIFNDIMSSANSLFDYSPVVFMKEGGKITAQLQKQTSTNRMSTWAAIRSYLQKNMVLASPKSNLPTNEQEISEFVKNAFEEQPDLGKVINPKMLADYIRDFGKIDYTNVSSEEDKLKIQEQEDKAESKYTPEQLLVLRNVRKSDMAYNVNLFQNTRAFIKDALSEEDTVTDRVTTKRKKSLGLENDKNYNKAVIELFLSELGGDFSNYNVNDNVSDAVYENSADSISRFLAYVETFLTNDTNNPLSVFKFSSQQVDIPYKMPYEFDAVAFMEDMQKIGFDIQDAIALTNDEIATSTIKDANGNNMHARRLQSHSDYLKIKLIEGKKRQAKNEKEKFDDMPFKPIIDKNGKKILTVKDSFLFSPEFKYFSNLMLLGQTDPEYKYSTEYSNEDAKDVWNRTINAQVLDFIFNSTASHNLSGFLNKYQNAYIENSVTITDKSYTKGNLVNFFIDSGDGEKNIERAIKHLILMDLLRPSKDTEILNERGVLIKPFNLKNYKEFEFNFSVLTPVSPREIEKIKKYKQKIQDALSKKPIELQNYDAVVDMEQGDTLLTEMYKKVLDMFYEQSKQSTTEVLRILQNATEQSKTDPNQTVIDKSIGFNLNPKLAPFISTLASLSRYGINKEDLAFSNGEKLFDPSVFVKTPQGEINIEGLSLNEYGKNVIVPAKALLPFMFFLTVNRQINTRFLTALDGVDVAGMFGSMIRFIKRQGSINGGGTGGRRENLHIMAVADELVYNVSQESFNNAPDNIKEEIRKHGLSGVKKTVFDGLSSGIKKYYSPTEVSDGMVWTSTRGIRKMNKWKGNAFKIGEVDKPVIVGINPYTGKMQMVKCAVKEITDNEARQFPAKFNMRVKMDFHGLEPFIFDRAVLLERKRLNDFNNMSGAEILELENYAQMADAVDYMAPASALKENIPATTLEFNYETGMYDYPAGVTSATPIENFGFILDGSSLRVQQKASDVVTDTSDNSIASQVHYQIIVDPANREKAEELHNTVAEMARVGLTEFMTSHPFLLQNDLKDAKEAAAKMSRNTTVAANLYLQKAEDVDNKIGAFYNVKENPLNINDPAIVNDVIQQIRSSLDGSIARIRVTGTKAVQISSTGYEKVIGSKMRKPVYNREQNYMEVYLPKKFKRDARQRYLEKILDENEALPKDKQKTKRELEEVAFAASDKKLIDNLEFSISYRIPSTGLNSIARVKPIGFLETETNVIVVPQEWQFVSGSDFDVDALFINYASTLASLDFEREMEGMSKRILRQFNPNVRVIKHNPIGFSPVKDKNGNVILKEVRNQDGVLITDFLKKKMLSIIYDKTDIKTGRKEFRTILRLYNAALQNKYLSGLMEMMGEEHNREESQRPISFDVAKDIEDENSLFNIVAFNTKSSEATAYKKAWEAAKESGTLLERNTISTLEAMRDKVVYDKLDPFTVHGSVGTQIINTQGASLTGPAANLGKVLAYSIFGRTNQNKAISIHKDLHFKLDGITYDSIGKMVKINPNDENSKSVFDYVDERGVKTFKTIQWLVNAAIDNGKELIAYVIGLSTASQNAWFAGLSLNMSPQLIVKIMKQPVLKEVIASSKYNGKLVDKLLKELINNAFPKGTKITDSLVADFLKKASEIAVFEKDLEAVMNTDLVTQLNKLQNNKTALYNFALKQAAVLAMFSKMNTIGSSGLFPLQKAIGLVQHIPTTAEEVDSFNDAMKRFYTTKSNVTVFLNEQIATPYLELVSSKDKLSESNESLEISAVAQGMSVAEYRETYKSSLYIPNSKSIFTNVDLFKIPAFPVLYEGYLLASQKLPIATFLKNSPVVTNIIEYVSKRNGIKLTVGKNAETRNLDMLRDLFMAYVMSDATLTIEQDSVVYSEVMNTFNEPEMVINNEITLSRTKAFERRLIDEVMSLQRQNPDNNLLRKFKPEFDDQARRKMLKINGLPSSDLAYAIPGLAADFEKLPPRIQLRLVKYNLIMKLGKYGSSNWSSLIPSKLKAQLTSHAFNLIAALNDLQSGETAKSKLSYDLLRAIITNFSLSVSMAKADNLAVLGSSTIQKNVDVMEDNQDVKKTMGGVIKSEDVEIEETDSKTSKKVNIKYNISVDVGRYITARKQEEETAENKEIEREKDPIVSDAAKGKTKEETEEELKFKESKRLPPLLVKAFKDSDKLYVRTIVGKNENGIKTAYYREVGSMKDMLAVMLNANVLKYHEMMQVFLDPSRPIFSEKALIKEGNRYSIRITDQNGLRPGDEIFTNAPGDFSGDTMRLFKVVRKENSTDLNAYKKINEGLKIDYNTFAKNRQGSVVDKQRAWQEYREDLFAKQQKTKALYVLETIAEGKEQISKHAGFTPLSDEAIQLLWQNQNFQATKIESVTEAMRVIIENNPELIALHNSQEKSCKI